MGGDHWNATDTVVTEWKEFRTPDFDAILTALRTPVVFDGRNLYEPAMMARFGLAYHCIGRAAIDAPAATVRR